MKVLTWNLHGANEKSGVWDLITGLHPDVALLQEVGKIPDGVLGEFDVISRTANNKKGMPQRFSTAILVRGKIRREIELRSAHEWINNELAFLRGSSVACELELRGGEVLNAVSIYSPPWPVDRRRLIGVDSTAIRTKRNPDVWATDIIWSALKHSVINGTQWIVGGDYNASETFDKEWQDAHGITYGLRSSGNTETLERMKSIGFTECLRAHQGRIIPTFKHSGGAVEHQIDHLFVTSDLYHRLRACDVGEQAVVFERALSDHLPIIAEFND